MTRTLLWLLLAALPSLAASGSALAADKIGSEVYARLRTVPRVTVVVALKESTPAHDAAQRDARTQRIAASADAVLAALPDGSYTLRRRFEHVAALSMDVSTKAVDALRRQAEVARVDLDVGGGAQMLEAAPLAHVSNVRARGLVGMGVKTAVIDSGARLNHPDLADSIVGQQCFCSSATPGTGCCPNGSDTQSGAGAAADGNGHGTNVTGIITGNGTQSPLGGAPAASTVVVRMLDDQGRFNSSADIVAALDWIASHHPDTKVVNLSLGTDQLFAGNCDTSTAWTIALAQAAAAVAANGTLMTVSSGNQASPTSIAAPACLSNVLAVGAVWDSTMPNQNFLGCVDTGIVADRPTCFTNSSVNVALYAPGAYTVSTGLAGATSSYGGTSQAAPLVAACIADLFQFKPTLTRERVKSALIASPTRVVDPKNSLSFPRLDCEQALIDIDRIFADGLE
ncbi:S8 family serine peptidase [Dokdonella sp.]|uniref:S8 family peptidase n=1 Tax=Dokdonella sp. TaxID=2291710 RepID=UPI001B056F39|nr:S8 family serine peptidase [Dokdonella sp.]MBO9663562.1 S8 family serine peptidase [Dokdonella sp.]